MKNSMENLGINNPKNQTKLYGFDIYFNFFSSLYKKKKLPNTILLSGPKGSGKATFAYHFINYLLSFEDDNKYDSTNFQINSTNKNFIQLLNGTHPNFYLIDSDKVDENIKIEKIRNAISFLNKTTYSSNIKIVLIDNVEFLNIYSANALLKVLEEGNDKTFFFLIYNNFSKILNTIKSRSIEFKFFFTLIEKKDILQKIIDQYQINIDINSIEEKFYLETPGNLIKYLMMLGEGNFNSLNDKKYCILFLIDEFKKKNDPLILNLISFLIEIFYNELSFKNLNNLHFYTLNKLILLKEINETRNFNLDKKNLFLKIQDTIQNEK